MSYFKEQSCGKCLYWKKTSKPEDPVEVGECRRFPPQVVILVRPKEEVKMTGGRLQTVVTPQQVPQGFFPVMKSEDVGCAEYEYRDLEEHLGGIPGL